MYSMTYRIALLFSFVLPLQIALNPAEGVDLALARILIPVIFLVWLIESLFSKKISLPTSPGAVFLYTFLFLASFSLFFANNHSWGIRKLAFLFSIFPLYFVISSTFSDTDKKKVLVSYFTAGAAITALIGLAQFSLQYVVGIDKAYRWWGENIAPIFLGESFSQAVLKNSSWLVNAGGKDFFRAISVFPDPHMLSFYLNMTLPFAIFLAIKSSSKKRIFWSSSSLIIFAADILTFSRGGYIGLAVMAFILFALFFKKLSVKFRLTACALLFFATIILLLFPNPISQRFASSFDASEGSNSGRIETWSQAFEVIKRNPLGVGIGNYALAIKPSADYREPIYAHSVYLDIAAEMGIFALLFWIAFLGGTFLSFHKQTDDLIFRFALIASMAAFASHSLVENPLFSIHIFSLLMIITALANKNNHTKQYA